MIRDLADVFGVPDLVIRSNNKDRSRVDAIKGTAFNQYAVVLAEGSVAMIACRCDLIHSRPAAPHHRFIANGRSMLMQAISTPGTLEASSLKRLVSASQTGVSREGML